MERRYINLHCSVAAATAAAASAVSGGLVWADCISARKTGKIIDDFAGLLECDFRIGFFRSYRCCVRYADIRFASNGRQAKFAAQSNAVAFKDNYLMKLNSVNTYLFKQYVI